MIIVAASALNFGLILPVEVMCSNSGTVVELCATLNGKKEFLNEAIPPPPPLHGLYSVLDGRTS